MSTPYLSEIRSFAFGLVPKGWAQCAGQTMAISSNQPLFALIGTTYGGDGVRTFALPDLRGRVGVGLGGSYTPGQTGGEEQHALTVAEMPGHTHSLNANVTPGGAGPTPSPSVVLGVTSGSDGTLNLYDTSAPAGTMAPQAVGNVGSGQPHPNLGPYLAVNWCMALQGIFPNRN